MPVGADGRSGVISTRGFAVDDAGPSEWLLTAAKAASALVAGAAAAASATVLGAVGPLGMDAGLEDTTDVA